MKIALLISGQPRRYRNGYKELKKWFLDRYDIDVYLHAWEAEKFEKYNFFNQGKLEKTHHVNKNLYDNLINWYQPKNYLFEKSIQFDHKNLKGKNNQRLNSQMGMWMSLKRVWDLMESSGTQYDLIFKTRYDLLFTHKVANNCPLLEDLTQFDPSQLHHFGYAEDWPHTNYQMNDQIAIGGYNVMKTYCNLFPQMLNTIFVDPSYSNDYDDIFINETLIFHYLKTNNIPMSPITSGFNGSRGIDCGCDIMR
jgi:hypothetical protein|tara:strand:+ start:3550 stop:4302 length:753 start_codon:yes stop_codon:yes gene_type:complete